MQFVFCSLAHFIVATVWEKFVWKRYGCAYNTSTSWSCACERKQWHISLSL